MDNPKVQPMMDSLWKLSIPNPADPNTWRERFMYVYDSSGTTVFRISPLSSGSTPCTTTSDDAGVAPGVLLAEMHIHPFAVGDTLPVACNDPQDPPGTRYQYVSPFGGPSRHDWNRTAAVPPRTSYIIDRTTIYRARPGLNQPEDPVSHDYIPDVNDIPNYLTTWKRHQPNCSIVSEN